MLLVWIGVVNLLLQFWSLNIFKAIRDYCVGWVETEEETQLQNHLKWARVKVKGDGTEVPRVVTLEEGGFLMPVRYGWKLWFLVIGKKRRCNLGTSGYHGNWTITGGHV